MNIILCGLPMCGKSTIGKLISQGLGWNFIDTDRLIEQAYAKQTGKLSNCRQIYHEEGEMIFRNLETQQILSLSKTERTVISLGGGAMNKSENIPILTSIGFIMYLKVDTQTLWRRLCQKGTPAYLNPENPKDAFFTIAAERTPIYEDNAVITIETDNMLEKETADKIISLLKQLEIRRII